MKEILAERYRIIRPLREGSVAKTFLAEDIKDLDHSRCVIKQLSPITNDAETLEVLRRLFVQEAIVLEKLGKHDQIPTLIDSFEESQNFFLVQSYVSGHDLDEELIPGQKWEESKVIKLLQEILEVLEFVHAHKIIHRDLKPSNIRRREDGKIVLIDFGAVKELRTQQARLLSETTYTVAVQTQGYTPVEQTKGKPKLCSDLYTVGVIAVQALTGLKPNQIPEDLQTSELDWRSQAQVSSSLFNFINNLVRYKWSDRYLSAKEALQALRSCKTLKEEAEQAWYDELSKLAKEAEDDFYADQEGWHVRWGGHGLHLLGNTEKDEKRFIQKYLELGRRPTRGEWYYNRY